MKNYEIKLIKAQLVAEIAEHIDYHIASLHEVIKSDMQYYENSEDEYNKKKYQENLLKSDLITKIKITVDGIEL
ncbi:MAG: hypothetical protein E7587_02545 [Ruminococcaceae bacterium]|nr:hypothetical protein [Oscillospiraceae bacterium]